jgi:DNA-binding NarL/FixJ family response regulator
LIDAIGVLIVEDHAIFREAVVSEFDSEPDFEIVGQAASLAEARQMLGSADVVILDLGLPDGSGADLIPELRAANPNAHALVLTASYDRTMATTAIEHGASAVLDKVTHLGEIAQTARRVLAGQRPLPRVAADRES